MRKKLSGCFFVGIMLVIRIVREISMGVYVYVVIISER